MPRLVATASFPYGIPSRSLSPGDEFDATEKDAEILKFAQKARDVEVRARAVEEVQARAVKSDEPSHVGKRYRRSDMRADD